MAIRIHATIVTCHGARRVTMATEPLKRPTVPLRPWKIRHVLAELQAAAAQDAARGRR